MAGDACGCRVLVRGVGPVPGRRRGRDRRSWRRSGPRSAWRRSMALVSTADIVGAAWQAGRGALACNIITLEHAEAVVAGAARAATPVILQISHNCVDYHGSLAPIGLGAPRDRAPGARSRCPCTSIMPGRSTWSVEAIELGIGSVMFDASHLDDEANLTADTRGHRGVPSRGCLGRGRAGRGGRQGRRPQRHRADRPGCCGELRGGDWRGRPGRGRRHLPCPADSRRDARPGPGGQAPGSRAGATRPPWLVERPRRGAGGSGRGRHDQDQHRHAARPGVHRRGPDPALAGRPADGRLAALPGRRPGGRSRPRSSDSSACWRAVSG